MRSVIIAGLSLALFMSSANAQTTPPASTTTPPARRAARPQDLPDPNAPTSKYDYHDAFAPFFYTKNGTEYRAATGEPGPKYWQNRADYQLAATLNDETNEITGTEIVTYTNNSPQKMEFVWMMLDQNLFKQDSRGSAIIPVAGSRNGGRFPIFNSQY